MKATITKNGILIIEPLNQLEDYALMQWNDKRNAEVNSSSLYLDCDKDNYEEQSKGYKQEYLLADLSKVI